MKKALCFGIVISLLLIITIGCTPNYEQIFEENNLKFNDNRSLLNKTLSLIEKDYVKKWDSKMGIILEVEEFDEELKKNLLELGVGSVEISGHILPNCDKNYTVIFHIVEGWNISTLRTVQLIYAPCNFNTKRDRKKRLIFRNHQDFWGQGGDWFVYSDTDKF